MPSERGVRLDGLGVCLLTKSEGVEKAELNPRILGWCLSRRCYVVTVPTVVGCFDLLGYRLDVGEQQSWP